MSMNRQKQRPEPNQYQRIQNNMLPRPHTVDSIDTPVIIEDKPEPCKSIDTSNNLSNIDSMPKPINCYARHDKLSLIAPTDHAENDIHSSSSSKNYASRKVLNKFFDNLQDHTNLPLTLHNETSHVINIADDMNTTIHESPNGHDNNGRAYNGNDSSTKRISLIFIIATVPVIHGMHAVHDLSCYVLVGLTIFYSFCFDFYPCVY